jgi:hypothetical protein
MNEKMFKQLTGLVGYPTQVTLRSNPETLITGTLSSFDLTDRFLTIVNDKATHFINLDDLSILRTQRKTTE